MFAVSLECYKGRYARITSPEKLVFKENANLRLSVDGNSQLLAIAAGNTLSVDKPYHHLSTTSIQKKARR